MGNSAGMVLKRQAMIVGIRRIQSHRARAYSMVTRPDRRNRIRIGESFILIMVGRAVNIG